MLKTFWDKYKYYIIVISAALGCQILALFPIETFPSVFALLIWKSILIKVDESVSSDIAAILGVIVSISIPISLDVINRTADRYQNQRISSFFIKEPLYKGVLYSNILCVLMALLFKISSLNNLGIILILYLWFAVNLFLFIRFIYLIQHYIINIDDILLGHCFKKTLKWFVKDIKTSREGLYNILDNNLNYFVQIGSVQVREDKDVQKLMRIVSLLLRKTLKIKRTDPAVFDKLLWTEDEFRFSKHYPITVSAKYNQKEVYRLYNAYFKVYEKIWDAAVKNKNESASLSAIKFMFRISEILSKSHYSKDYNNSLVINYLLSKIHTIFRNSINKINSDPILENTVDITSGHYYYKIIFMNNDKSFNNGLFKYQYIPIYNKWFLSTVDFLVQNNYKKIFERQISYIYQSSIGYFWYITTITVKIFTDKSKKPSFQKIQAKEELEAVLDNKENPKSAEDKLKCVWYYYNSLRKNIFIIGALCIFHNKPEYIQFIWDYFSEDDQIYDPSYFEINDLMGFYLSGYFKTKLKYDYVFKDQIDYEDQYLLLSLARIIKKENLKEIKLEESIKKSCLERKQEDLRTQLYELEKNQKLLDTLNIDSQTLKIIHDFLSIGINKYY